jgi:large subunit ribosomal protein L17
MRHGKKINHLGRTASHRKSMLANMACSLIEHKRINTTTAKAKALKQFVEPLITKAKADNNSTIEKSTHNRRVAFSYLRNKEAVAQLFSEVSEKVADRQGGYTRIIKLGNRLGDSADMALIELVDFNETYNATEKKAKSTRRSRRSKSAETKEAAPAVEEVAVAEAPTTAEEAAPEAETTEETTSEAETTEESTDEEIK